MAKIIDSSVDSRVIAENFPFAKVIVVGLLSGLFFWLLTWLLDRYLIAPYYCIGSTISCSESIAASGKITAIIVIVSEIFIMIKLRMAQPLIVSTTTAAVLWGLAEWTNGLVLWEVILFDVLMYLIAYLLFCWIVRYDKLWPVLIGILIIVMFARIVANI